MSIDQPRKPSGRFDVTARAEADVDLTPRRYTTSVEREAFLDSAEILRRDSGSGFTKVRVDGPDPDAQWPDESDVVSFEATPVAVAEYLEEYELDDDAVTPVPPKWPAPARSALDLPAVLPAAQPIDLAQRRARRGAEETIAASMWSTSALQGFALSLQSYDDYTKPVWAQVAHTEAEAREYYAELLAEHPEQARSEAAEALAATGWTARAIGLKKS